MHYTQCNKFEFDYYPQFFFILYEQKFKKYMTYIAKYFFNIKSYLLPY